MSRRTLAGYELEHRLDRGATSTVWRARQTSSLGRPVAVKRVLAAGRADAADEAAVLATLDHPHIVRVLDVVPDGDGLAIVMPLASGGSLDERLARRGAVAADEVVSIVTKLAEALASAHRHGVLHRDVKPANILFTSDGEPLLADFGIAAWRSRPDDGLVRGTEGYLDPRVRAGAEPDAPADLYALAAVAVEMLTGSLPAGAYPSEQSDADTDVASLPDGLARTIERAMSPDESRRFASAEAFLAALARTEPDSADAVVASETMPDRGRCDTRTFGPRPPRPVPIVAVPRWPVPTAVAGLVLLLLGGWLVTRPGPVAPHQPAAGPARSCPEVASTPAVLVADVDGDGCRDAVAVAGNVIDRGGVKFSVGEPGDQVVLGDWDCDGAATPAAFRHAAQRAYLFDGWAAHDGALPAARSVQATVPPVSSCP